MASESKKGCLAKALCYPVSVFSKCLNPPRPSQDSILYWYIPLAGGASYTAFSIHIFNPNSLVSLFPNGNHMVANMLLFNTHLGAGLYLFNRKHLALAPMQYRLMYSVYGAVIFNFGSILLWALSKVALPESSWVRGTFAISASLGMLLIGREYLHYVDSKIPAVKK